MHVNYPLKITSYFRTDTTLNGLATITLSYDNVILSSLCLPPRHITVR